VTPSVSSKKWSCARRRNGAADELVAKHVRAVVRADRHRQPARAAEVARLPRDLVAETEQARCRAVDDAFAALGCGLQVQLDAQREVEAALARCGDLRVQLEAAHSTPRSAG
jgi:hypothetical protein